VNAATASATKSPAGSNVAGHGTSAANKAKALSAAQPAASQSATQAAARHLPGNLSVPSARPASRRVAHALSGRTHAQPASGGPAGTQ
jgi:hypothetical protein